jgi:hypothetical protein
MLVPLRVGQIWQLRYQHYRCFIVTDPVIAVEDMTAEVSYQQANFWNGKQGGWGSIHHHAFRFDPTDQTWHYHQTERFAPDDLMILLWGPP